MKLIRRLSLCLLVPLCFATLARADGALSEYEKAVKAYVEAAGNELKALQMQAEADLKTLTDAKKDARENFQAAFDQYAAAYERLRKASAKEFDEAKSAYEKQRQVALDALAAARRS